MNLSNIRTQKTSNALLKSIHRVECTNYESLFFSGVPHSLERTYFRVDDPWISVNTYVDRNTNAG